MAKGEGWHVVHLDASAEAVGEVALRLPWAAAAGRVVQGDARALPFAAGSFDVVLDKGACERGLEQE
jgi:hypothetical protein